MTPQEYLEANPKWFLGLRLFLHSFKLISDAGNGRTQAFREAPTHIIAALALHRHKVGEHTEARSTIETAAFYAEKEFARRVRTGL